MDPGRETPSRAGSLIKHKSHYTQWTVSFATLLWKDPKNSVSGPAGEKGRRQDIQREARAALSGPSARIPAYGRKNLPPDPVLPFAETSSGSADSPASVRSLCPPASLAKTVCGSRYKAHRRPRQASPLLRAAAEENVFSSLFFSMAVSLHFSCFSDNS